jgi:hypothetical protein
VSQMEALIVVICMNCPCSNNEYVRLMEHRISASQTSGKELPSTPATSIASHSSIVSEIHDATSTRFQELKATRWVLTRFKSNEECFLRFTPN